MSHMWYRITATELVSIKKMLDQDIGVKEGECAWLITVCIPLSFSVPTLRTLMASVSV